MTRRSTRKNRIQNKKHETEAEKGIAERMNNKTKQGNTFFKCV